MREKLKRCLKLLFKIIIIIIICIIIFFIYSYTKHKINSNQELNYIKNFDTGKIIDVDSQKVNYKIFNEENTEKTIVLMSGSGATDLSLSFEPLANNINAKIILINRPGYGFSDDTNKKADIDYIVNFYRNVLKKLNVSDKIILMPHSISGIYSMYWAEVYPSEIESIIGLDIGSPYIYVNQNNSFLTNNISYFGSKLGIHRFIYKMGNSTSAIKNYNIYQDDYFKAIWYMNMINPYSKFNLSEENLIKKNANKVIKNMNNNYHNIKKLYIIANYISGSYYEDYEKNDLLDYYKSEEEIKKYIEKVKENQEEEKKSLSIDNNTTLVQVEGPHLLYYYPTDKLIKTINDFISAN